MFDVAPTELLLVAAVALVVIGPKDLPATMRTVGRWVGKARGVASHFRSGFDQMVREAELEEMEKRWAAENARIMREHPPEPAGVYPPAIEGGVSSPNPAEWEIDQSAAPAMSVGVAGTPEEPPPPSDEVPQEARPAPDPRPLP